MEVVTAAKDGSGRQSPLQGILDKDILPFNSPGFQTQPEIAIHSNNLKSS
jgi:hypothetical protein